jgi:hypothetical protein
MRITRSLRALLALCVAAAIGTAVWTHVLYDGGRNQNRAFLGTDTRSQCLFIGCALAIALVMLAHRSHEEGRLAKGELWRPSTAAGQHLCAALGIVGAVVAVLMWVVTTSFSSFPYHGGFFVIGVAVAAVILSAVAVPASIVPRVLSVSPVRYVGRISYGLYIWHWPVFIWLNHERTGYSGYPLFVVRVLVTFAISVASFHLVERPIRMGTFLRQWKAWVAVPAGAGLVLAAVVAATTGTTAVASTAFPAGLGTTGSTTTTTSAPLGSGPPVRVLLFGDSVALTLGLGLSDHAAQAKYGYVLSDKGILGCGVVFGPEVEIMGARDATPAACDGSSLTQGEPADQQPWPYQWLDAINVVHPNVVVVLAGRWEVTDREYQGRWTNILSPAYAAYVKQQLEATSKLVTSAGSHLVFLTAPCTSEGEQPDGAPWPEDDPRRVAEYNKLVRQVATAHPETDSVVDLNAAACPKGKFASTVDGIVMRRPDGVHFTLAGGVALIPALMPAIVASGRSQMATALPAGTTTTTTTTTSTGR